MPVALGGRRRVLPPIDPRLQVDYRTLPPPRRLLEAARRGDAAVVAATLAFGVPVDSRDREGNTALVLAALAGHQGIAARLLDAGADVNVVTAVGVTPLFAAVIGGHAGMVGLLAARGGAIDALCRSTPCAGTALNTALAWLGGRAPAVVRALLAAGADPHREYRGRNAFDHAIESFHEDLLPLLRAASAARSAGGVDRGAEE